MPLKFVTTKRTFGFDKSQTVKYVARQVLNGEIDTKKLCTQVCQICGAHRGVVQQVLTGLVDVMVNNLDNGYSIRFGEFGIFKPAIRAKAADTEKEANGHSVYRRRIAFVPGEALKDMLEKAKIRAYEIPDTDYTVNGNNNDGSGNNNGGNGSGGNGEDEFVDPTT